MQRRKILNSSLSVIANKQEFAGCDRLWRTTRRWESWTSRAGTATRTVPFGSSSRVADRSADSTPNAGASTRIRTTPANVTTQCRDCCKQYSCKLGTAMKWIRIAVREWLIAMYTISVSRKDIFSLRLVKKRDRPKKTTSLMLQRIKEACHNEEPFRSDVVEADEQYVGGSVFNRHEFKL